jgi:hypothetical protein
MSRRAFDTSTLYHRMKGHSKTHLKIAGKKKGGVGEGDKY